MRAPTLLSLALIAVLGAQGAVCEWVCSEGATALNPGMAINVHDAPCHAAPGAAPEPAERSEACPACEEGRPLLTARAFDGPQDVSFALALPAASDTFAIAAVAPRLMPRPTDLPARTRDRLQITSSLRL